MGKSLCKRIYKRAHKRKTVCFEMYTLTGRESRLSVALVIGHVVMFPLGNTDEHLLHAA